MRRYRQRRLPLLASMAITWLFGEVTNMTPLLTIGADSCGLASLVEKTQTGRRRATLEGVI
jgi:hypothetical protein